MCKALPWNRDNFNRRRLDCDLSIRASRIILIAFAIERIYVYQLLVQNNVYPIVKLEILNKLYRCK